MQKGFKCCFECGRKMERCRGVSVDEAGEVQWVCPKCWRELEYEKYMTKPLRAESS